LIYIKEKPFINTMGRFWGSSRFMSSEEFELGAKIDERTNEFNMGESHPGC
jgi:serine/threonine protein kinase, bacterial